MEIRIGIVILFNMLWFNETMDYESCSFISCVLEMLSPLCISLCRMLQFSRTSQKKKKRQESQVLSGSKGTLSWNMVWQLHTLSTRCGVLSVLHAFWSKCSSLFSENNDVSNFYPVLGWKPFKLLLTCRAVVLKIA